MFWMRDQQHISNNGVPEARHLINPTLSEAQCGASASHLQQRRAGSTLQRIIEEITLIDSNSVLHKKSSVFLSKSSHSMMLFLSHDIADNLIFITKTIAETSIFPSPPLKKWEMRICLHPFTTVSLHSLNERGQR